MKTNRSQLNQTVPSRRRATLLAGAASAALLGWAAATHAQVTYTWTNTASGNWGTNANWQGSVQPVSNNANTAIFDGSTNYTVTYDKTTNPFILNSLQFNNSSAAGITLGTSNAFGISLRGTGANLRQDGSSPVNITLPFFYNIAGSITGAGTGDISISSLAFTAGATLTLNNASNVSIGSFTHTAVDAKTITNNIAAAGKSLTIGSIGIAGVTSANSLTIGGSGTTTVTGVISESGSIAGSFTKADGGTVFLQGANTFTGTLQANNGVLDVNSLADSGAGSNGTGTIKILNGGQAAATLRYSGPGAILTRGIDIFGTGATAGSAIIDNSGTGALTIGGVSQSASGATKTLQLQGTYTGSTNTVAGVISNGGGTLSVAKAGPGTWTLNGINTYTGATSVTGGTLIAGTTGAFGGSQSFSVSSGAQLNASLGGISLNAGGTFSAGHTSGSAADVIGDVSLTGSTLTVAGNGAAGTFTHNGNLSLATGSTVRFDLSNVNTPGGFVNDLVATSGNLTLNGAISVNLNALNGPLAPGKYTLFTYGGALTGDASNFASPTGLAPGRSTYGYDTTSTPGSVLLTVTGAAGNLTWVGGTNANAWDVQSTLNFTGEADSHFYDGDVVNFTAAGAGNSPVNLSGTVQPFTVNVTGGDYTIAGTGAIGGNAVINKSGSGTLTIQTPNTYTGATNVTGGTLVVANATALGTAAGGTAVSTGAQVQLQNVGTIVEPFTINGTGIGGAGALQNAAGANTLGGLVTLGSDATIANADGTDALTFDVASGSAINTANFTLTFAGPGSIVVNDPLAIGTGGFVKSNAGTLTLAGTTANTGSGSAVINAGTLLLNKTAGVNAISGSLTVGNGTDAAITRLSAANQIADTSAVTVNAGSSLDLNGFSDTIGSLQGSGPVTLGATPGTVLTVNGSNTTTYSGVISGTGGFSRTGAGTTVLAGQNTYTGTTNIQNDGATIRLGVDNALPVGTTITFSGTTNGAGANADVVVDLNGKNQTIAALTSATTTGVVYIQNNSGAGTSVLTITNGTGIFGATTGTAQIRDNDGAAIGGKVALTITGGTTTLGAATTYSGPTTISGGTLATSKASALSPNSAIDLQAAGTLDLAGFAQTISSVSGTGLLTNSSSTAAALTLTTANFGGVISGPTSLIKANGGIATLTGTANTFSGNIEIRNGEFQVYSLGDTGAGANGTGAIRILNGNNASAKFTYLGAGSVTTRAFDIFGTGNNTTAIVDSSGTGPLTFGGASISGTSAKIFTLQGTNAGANTVAGVISDGTASLAVAKAGSGSWILSADNTYSGNTTITGGTLKLATAGTNNIPSSPVISVSAGAILDVSQVAGGFALKPTQTLTGGGSIAGPVTVGGGATISPGTNVGTITSTAQTWAAGGQYLLQIADASNGSAIAAGTNWDAVSLTGGLTITATSGSPFVLKLNTLTGTASGPAAKFDSSQSYAWTIASTGGVSGFDPSKVVVDASGFLNPTDGGTFGLTNSGNDVVLTFTSAVPEPAVSGLVGLTGAGLLARRRRRNLTQNRRCLIG